MIKSSETDRCLSDSDKTYEVLAHGTRYAHRDTPRTGSSFVVVLATASLFCKDDASGSACRGGGGEQRKRVIIRWVCSSGTNGLRRDMMLRTDRRRRNRRAL